MPPNHSLNRTRVRRASFGPAGTRRLAQFVRRAAPLAVQL